MANRDNPFGAKPWKSADGTPYKGQTMQVTFGTAAGDCFVGDWVTQNTVDLDSDGQITVKQASVNEPLLGCVVAFLPEFSDEGTLTDNYRVTATERRALICPAIGMTFIMQSDEDTTPLVAADSNLNIDILDAQGSTITGISAQEIDATAQKGTATAQLRLHGLAQIPGNVFGSTAAGDRAIWVVSVNEATHLLHGVGV